MDPSCYMWLLQINIGRTATIFYYTDETCWTFTCSIFINYRSRVNLTFPYQQELDDLVSDLILPKDGEELLASIKERMESIEIKFGNFRVRNKTYSVCSDGGGHHFPQYFTADESLLFEKKLYDINLAIDSYFED